MERSNKPYYVVSRMGFVCVSDHGTKEPSTYSSENILYAAECPNLDLAQHLETVFIKQYGDIDKSRSLRTRIVQAV